MTQFWRGQRVVFQGMLGTVSQDQGLDKLVRIVLDPTDNLEYSVNPNKLHLLRTKSEVERAEYFMTRQYIP